MRPVGAADNLAAYVCKLRTIYSSEDRLHSAVPASPTHNVPTSPRPHPQRHVKFWQFPGGWTAALGASVAAAPSVNSVWKRRTN